MSACRTVEGRYMYLLWFTRTCYELDTTVSTMFIEALLALMHCDNLCIVFLDTLQKVHVEQFAVFVSQSVTKLLLWCPLASAGFL